jgi:hypothetical protein
VKLRIVAVSVDSPPVRPQVSHSAIDLFELGQRGAQRLLCENLTFAHIVSQPLRDERQTARTSGHRFAPTN